MGATKYMSLAKKLQAACNRSFGVKLLINSKQWYSEDQGRAVTQYSIHQSIWDEVQQKSKNVELFKTYSQVQLLLFMRDYWYQLNGWEIPKDNETWEEVKAKNAIGSKSG